MTGLDTETLRQALRAGSDPGGAVDVALIMDRGRRLRRRRLVTAVAGALCAVALLAGAGTGIADLARSAPAPAQPVSPAGPATHGTQAPARRPATAQAKPVPTSTVTPVPVATATPTATGLTGNPVPPKSVPTSSPASSASGQPTAAGGQPASGQPTGAGKPAAPVPSSSR